MSEPHVDISVVIATYRRPDELPKTLDDIAKQVTTCNYEVVVVLQSYDREFVTSLKDKKAGVGPLVLVDSSEPLGVFGARNEGIKKAKGRIVVFLDDDVRVPPTYIDSILPYFEDSKIGGIGGYVSYPERPHSRGEKLKHLYHRLFMRRYKIDWGAMHSQPFNVLINREQSADWLIGCNMVYRKDLLEQLGLFDARYGMYGFDDQDIAVRVRKLGYRLISTPKLNIEHYPSKVNRSHPEQFFFDEARRQVLFAQVALGDKPGWRTRYVLRQALYMLPRLPIWVLKRKLWHYKALVSGIRKGFEEVA